MREAARLEFTRGIRSLVLNFPKKLVKATACTLEFSL